MDEGDLPRTVPVPPVGGLGMIWAQDVTGVLGAHGGMLWRVPADFQHFKAMTMGCGLVMGRVTWDSLGGALRGRRNVVLTRDRQWRAPGALSASRLNEGLSLAARGLSASADAGQSDDPEERGRSRARQAAMAMTGAGEDDDAILLKGASALSAPSSRVETHWAGVLVAIVLFPLAWFLVHDGAATLTGGNPSAWPSAASPMGALEILGGTAACAAALFMISRSSLGAFVVGALSTVIGLPFILMPGVTKSILGPTVDRLQAHSDLGKALSTYVMDDGLSGRFILMGVLTIMVAVVGHLARRAGQRTQDEGRGPRD